jgi:hypothetical protein
MLLRQMLKFMKGANLVALVGRKRHTMCKKQDPGHDVPERGGFTFVALKDKSKLCAV